MNFCPENVWEKETTLYRSALSYCKPSQKKDLSEKQNKTEFFTPQDLLDTNFSESERENDFWFFMLKVNYRLQGSCEGYVFTDVCLSMGGGGVVSQHALQVVSQHALQQVSRGGAWSGGGAPEGVCSGGGTWSGGVCLSACWDTSPPPQEKRLLLQTVCIPLECILVHTMATTILPLLLSWTLPLVAVIPILPLTTGVANGSNGGTKLIEINHCHSSVNEP